MTHQEHISRTFTILKNQIEPYVVSALEQVDGADWGRKLREGLKKDEAYSDPSSNTPHLDVAALLYVIWSRWRDCFEQQYNFGYTHRSYVSELREARNKWAHQVDFDDDAAARTIDTARLLIKSFNGTNIQELLDLRNEILMPSLSPNIYQSDNSALNQPIVVRKNVDNASPVLSKRSPINRVDYVNRISEYLGESFFKNSISCYSTRDGNCRMTYAVSKRYDQSGGNRYWFSFYPSQKEFLDDAKTAFIAYGCGSLDKIILMPYERFLPLVEHLNTTIKHGRRYWHIHIIETATQIQLVLAGGDRVDVTEFRID
jgi:hypothetical protein